MPFRIRSPVSLARPLKYSCGSPIFMPLTLPSSGRGIIRHRSGRGRGIQRIAAGDRLQQSRRVPHVAPERSDVVERTGKRRQPIRDTRP